ncbi:helix-turn-helix domain-containing protein [Rhodocista pekingensis]|uniref:RodZ domain-containing protein n=1 Tax=Rhodocista pekingensis TaxID=201185 RepID=A0ABW2KRT8_9PROT
MPEQKRRYFDVIEGDPAQAGQGSHEPGPAPRHDIRHVGEMLRQRRLELGYDLPQLSEMLRIRLNYLEAIEQGRWADLPGQAYVTGFLRSYATAMELEPGPVLRRYKEDTAGAPPPAELYFPEPVNESRVPGGALILIALLAGLVVYGGWYMLSASDRSLSDMVPALPDRLAGLIYGDSAPEEDPAPAAVLPPGQVEALVGQSQPTAPEVGASVDQSAPAQSSPSQATPAQPGPSQSAATPAVQTPPAQPAGPQTAPPSVPSQTTAAEPQGEVEESEVPQLPDLGSPAVPPSAAEEPEAPAEVAEAQQEPAAPAPAPAAPPPGRVFGQTDGTVRVVIRATEDSWIQVRDGKGTLWASRVLRPGDSFRAPDVPGLVMNTGNAGGLVVSLDGQDLPPLGGRAQVMRDIRLTPQDLAGRAQR